MTTDNIDTPEEVRETAEAMRQLVTAKAWDVADDWRMNGPRIPVLTAFKLLERYADLLEQHDALKARVGELEADILRLYQEASERGEPLP